MSNFEKKKFLQPTQISAQQIKFENKKKKNTKQLQ